MRVDLFDFELPRERIAQNPAKPRDAARLLHVTNTEKDLFVRDLPYLLEPGDAIIVNNTKVLPCRLKGKSRGANIEVTLHKALNSDTWLAFAKPARKLNPRDRINFASGLEAKVFEKFDFGEISLIFNMSGLDFINALETSGFMPLPPYIKREDKNLEADRDSYQTLFASQPGAVAAPTAGLHFTPDLITNIKARGVRIVPVTLHVGAGTFLPVKVTDTNDHIMHTEWATLGNAAATELNKVRREGQNIIAVGSTALRVLETAARDDGVIHSFSGETDLFITPGYRFKAARRIMTNFHLPKSTLFMMVSAFSGLARMQRAYAHAIHSGYRFFSYGDACLLEPDTATWVNTNKG